MIVVDANILAYYFIQGAKTDQAIRLHQADSVWALPALWRHEFLNILATLGKTGAAPRKLLSEIWSAAATRLKDCERPVDYEKALLLAFDLKISAYDAQYLSLAGSLDIPFVTEDAKLIKASQGSAVNMAGFLASAGA
jgi:predicted nucleic acid-binding protein